MKRVCARVPVENSCAGRNFLHHVLRAFRVANRVCVVLTQELYHAHACVVLVLTWGGT